MEDGESYQTGTNSDDPPNAGDLFQSFGLRRFIKINNRVDGWLLEWNFYFLPIVSMLFYILFLCC